MCNFHWRIHIFNFNEWNHNQNNFWLIFFLTGYFIIHPSSGVVRTSKILKLEDFPVNFKVRATDSSNAAIFNEVEVKVEVIDENNFPPVFPSSLLEERLPEVRKCHPKWITKISLQNNNNNKNVLWSIQVNLLELGRVAVVSYHMVLWGLFQSQCTPRMIQKCGLTEGKVNIF